MEGFRWMRGARGLGAALVFLGFGAALLAYPAQVQRGLAQSVLYCLASLVPSLFPAGEVLGKLLGPVTRRLFRLPRACGATVLLSFLGGYPAGARGVSLLLEQEKITREQAGRMLCFCVAPGAAFVVTFVGWGLLGSLRLGWVLFGAVTLSGLLLGLLTGLGKPVPQRGYWRCSRAAGCSSGWPTPSPPRGGSCPARRRPASPSCWKSPGAWGRPPSWGWGRCSTPLAWPLEGCASTCRCSPFSRSSPWRRGSSSWPGCSTAWGRRGCTCF